MTTTFAFLASLWGPVLLAIGLGIFFSRPYYKMVYRNLQDETLATFTLGIAGIVLGILQISSYNVWESFTTGLVSFLGWGTLAKGLVFTIFPKLADKGGEMFLHTRLLLAAGAVMVVIGAYLSWLAYIA